VKIRVDLPRDITIGWGDIIVCAGILLIFILLVVL
jgi:hypothetical protein